MLTIKEFKDLKNGEIFATGILQNAPNGLFMSGDGGELRWVATKGRIDDWAIYCHWSKHPVEWIKAHGDKVQTKSNVERCVPCEDEVLEKYRY